jgi:hypothetical protein
MLVSERPCSTAKHCHPAIVGSKRRAGRRHGGGGGGRGGWEAEQEVLVLVAGHEYGVWEEGVGVVRLKEYGVWEPGRVSPWCMMRRTSTSYLSLPARRRKECGFTNFKRCTNETEDMGTAGYGEVEGHVWCVRVYVCVRACT